MMAIDRDLNVNRSAMPSTQTVTLSVLVPVGALLVYTVAMRAIGIGSLGPIGEPLVYLAIVSLGFAYLRRASGGFSVVWAFVYYPLVLVIAFAVTFVVLGAFGALEL